MLLLRVDRGHRAREKNKRKPVKKFIGWFIVLFVEIAAGMPLWSFAGSLVTAKSDMEVSVGFGLYGIMTLIGIVTIWVLMRQITRHTKIINRARKVGAQTKVLSLIMIGALMLMTNGCTKVPPGYVGIKVNQYGTQRGVQDFPIQTGQVWYNPFTTNVYQFPTFLQNVVWTRSRTEGSANDDSITFNSIEGAVINADIALSYGFKGDKVPEIFVRFRQDANHITQVYMRSKVRDAFSRVASTYKVTDIFGAKKQEVLNKVKADLNAELGPEGFYFDMVSFIGALRVDPLVEQSINAVIQANQRAIEAQNKIVQSQAEAQQEIAKANGQAQSILIQARAQADANDIIAKSLTPEMVQWQAIKTWNGVLPQVTGGAMPFVQLGQGSSLPFKK